MVCTKTVKSKKKEEIFVPLELNDSRKEELITILSKELVVLRAKSGVSQDELSKGVGLSRQTYQAIESGKRRMTWRTYLAVLLFFDYNPLTHDMLRSLNVFPAEFLNAKQLLSEVANYTADRDK